MRGCGCGCFMGALLIPIAVIALLLFAVLPAIIDIKTIPSLNSALQSILCERGELLSTEQHVGPADDGGTAYSVSYYCDNNDAPKRDVTGRATLIGVGVFVVPFFIGLFMIIGGSMGMAARAAKVAVGGAASTILTMSQDARVNNYGSPGAKDSITERLKALKNAYDQGLITETEYENKRQDILSKM